MPAEVSNMRAYRHKAICNSCRIYFFKGVFIKAYDYGLVGYVVTSISSW